METEETYKTKIIIMLETRLSQTIDSKEIQDLNKYLEWIKERQNITIQDVDFFRQQTKSYAEIYV